MGECWSRRPVSGRIAFDGESGIVDSVMMTTRAKQHKIVELGWSLAGSVVWEYVVSDAAVKARPAKHTAAISNRERDELGDRRVAFGAAEPECLAHHVGHEHPQRNVAVEEIEELRIAQRSGSQLFSDSRLVVGVEEFVEVDRRHYGRARVRSRAR